MNTYIISSKSYNDSAIETEKILDAEHVNKFDRTHQEFEKDLGIADVRQIQKKVYLKPLKGERKANILVLHKSATIEAQNALLKLFEEPPTSSIIIVHCASYHI
jgi:DNA polymerase III gamma/tau subunit